MLYLKASQLPEIASVLADTRARDLVALVHPSFDPDAQIRVVKGKVNLYISGTGRILTNIMDDYFGGFLSDAEREAIGKTLPHVPRHYMRTTAYRYPGHAKKFEDGFVQYCDLGPEWGSRKGYANVLYAHVRAIRR